MLPEVYGTTLKCHQFYIKWEAYNILHTIRQV
jgi:hypothetical protein